MAIGYPITIVERLIMCATYDLFVVESLLQGYRMPRATKADRAAAVQTLLARDLTTIEVAVRLDITQRSVERLRSYDVEPLPEDLPDWADDYEREWPKCDAGHELTPDNIKVNIDKRNGYRRSQCRMCRADRSKEKKLRQKVSA